ncbi:MAG: tetratricopeptide repeat protein [Silvanigrellales bacterium]|nr:tetratricopeptide repeat protein [Silvanigrellales bacterium]
MRHAAVLTQSSGLTQTVSRSLAALGGSFEVQFKENAQDALAFFLNKRPDFIIYDWSMSGVQETCEFLQRLRKASGCRNVPIIVLAKELSSQIVAIGTEYGFSKILSERTVAQTLQPAVESVLAELSKPSSLRSHLVRLELAVEKQAFGEIDRLIEDFYHLYPEHPRALVEYGNLCMRRGNWNKAKQVLEVASRNFPENLRVVNAHARLAMHSGQRSEALSLLEKADLLSPKNLERLIIFGDVFRVSGDSDSARAYYEQAIEVDATSAAARKGLGAVVLSEGDVNAALELFRDSASEEEIGGFFNNTAILAVREQEFDKASRLYEAARNALTSDTLRAKVTFNLGLAYRKWNKLEQAVEAFNEALRFDPTFEKAQKALETCAPELPGKVTGISQLEEFEPMETLAPAPSTAPRQDPQVSPHGISIQDTQQRLSLFRVKMVGKDDVDHPKPPPPKFLDDEEDF